MHTQMHTAIVTKKMSLQIFRSPLRNCLALIQHCCSSSHACDDSHKNQSVSANSWWLRRGSEALVNGS